MPIVEDRMAALDTLIEEICRRVGDQTRYLRFQKHAEGSIPSLILSHTEWPGEARCFPCLTRPGTLAIAIPGEPHEARYNVHLKRITGGQKITLHMMSIEKTIREIEGWLERITRDADALRWREIEAHIQDASVLQRQAKARREGAARASDIVSLEEPLDENAAPDPSFEEELRRLVAHNFPRDKKGRLLLGTAVLLAPRDPETARFQTNRRDLWYAAIGPKLRRDPQTIRIGWHWLIGENHTHRWSAAPWLWNPTEAARTGEAERLGVPDDLPWDRIGRADRAENLAALAGDATPAGRIAHTILLQDEGRIIDALAKWDLHLSHEVRAHFAGLGDPDICDAVRDALRSAALWHLPAVIAAERKRLTEWRDAKKGRPRKTPRLPLFPLPHEMGASRRRLFLGEREEGAIEFFIDSTASEARLPIVAWKRPLEIDLRRFGLWKEDAI